MGQYRFSIPASSRFSSDSLMACQIVGLEGIPWPGKTVLHEEMLLVTRNNNISGRLLVRWQTERFGELSLLTGTLPESEVPYALELELARGGLNRLRNQIAIWLEGGIAISEQIQDRLHVLVNQFSEALFTGNDRPKRTETCESIIDGTVELMFEVTDEFSRQIAAFQESHPDSIPVLAGCVVDEDPGVTIPAAVLALAAQKMGQPTAAEPSDLTLTSQAMAWADEPGDHPVRIVGPLLPFDNPQLPHWLPEDSSFEKRLEIARRMCRTLGDEFGQHRKIFHVVSGISGVGHQHFNYPQQLQMTLEMLEAYEQKAPNQSMLISFDQPWGERLSMATGGTPAMEIADSLINRGARIAALGLEFNLDYWPHGSLMRDPLQWVDLIDRWSQFGFPLVIYLS
ncbi:MAG: hypothetical protein P8M80_12015, partial [Pirellulaceae bacterium]|nr:hypothetical protein [Pirellulaceae bacterium]